MRLLFLQAHRETDRFFAASGVQLAQPTSGCSTSTARGLNALARDLGWEVEVLPLVAGQRSAKEKEWLESLEIFGIFFACLLLIEKARAK